MQTIDQVRDKDDSVFATLKEIMPVAENLLKIKSLKNTGNVMFLFLGKLGFLKTAILDSAETDNLYSFNVLFRAFLEHILKANYIFMRWVEEQNDEPGKGYLSLQPIEDLQYLKSWNWVAKACDAHMEKSPEEYLPSIYPEINSEELKRLEDINTKFRYRSIIKAINNILGDSDINFMHKIVPQYSHLSSFIHGGPIADEIINKYALEEDRAMYYVETCNLTVMMFYSHVRWIFLMLAGIDNKYNTYLIKINDEITKNF